MQVVLSLLCNVASLNGAETELLLSTFANAARGFPCLVVSSRCGERWLEAMLDVHPGFDLPRAMTSLKAVTSRQLHRLRGGPAGVWSAGYVAVSVGDALDPSRAATELCALSAAKAR